MMMLRKTPGRAVKFIMGWICLDFGHIRWLCTLQGPYFIMCVTLKPFVTYTKIHQIHDWPTWKLWIIWFLKKGGALVRLNLQVNRFAENFIFGKWLDKSIPWTRWQNLLMTNLKQICFYSVSVVQSTLSGYFDVHVPCVSEYRKERRQFSKVTYL